MRIQSHLASTIAMAFDECIENPAEYNYVKYSCDRTTRWLLRCKTELERLYQASCKAAIKGGRLYNSESIKWVCDRILCVPKDGASAIKTCPHGRPVAFEIRKNSIERQFSRLL